MKLSTKTPITIAISPTPHSAAVRDTIGAHASLGDASDAWHGAPTSIDAAATASDLGSVVTAGRKDLGWQAFLNPAGSANGHVGGDEAALSAQRVTVKVDDADLSASRAIGSAQASVGEADVGGLTTPYGLGVKVGGDLGEQAAMSGSALAGSKVKTLVAEAEVHGASFGAALSLQTENKITVLGPVVAIEGQPHRLARFVSTAVPIVDFGLSGVAEHVGLGLRLVGALNRTVVYEKFVAVDRLSAMMRQRAHWYRNAVETLAAVGVCVGVQKPSLRDVAADMGQIDKMREHETAAWKSSHSLFIGVSGGSFGLRGTLTASLGSGATYKLERLAGNEVRLSVEPTSIKGLRISGEAKLLGDVSADVMTAASQQRAWTFDLSMMSARQALHQALKGRLPGLMLAGSPDTSREAFAMFSLMQAEKLPVGVTSVTSQFAKVTAQSLGLGSIRLPEVLGGSSLGISTAHSWSLAASVSPDAAAFARTHERSSSKDMLMLGSIDHADSASLLTAVSIGPRGERISTPSGISTRLSRQISDGGSFGRQRLAGSITQALGTATLPISNVMPSRRYAVEVAQTIGIEALEEAGQCSDQTIEALAVSQQLPVRLLRQVRDAIAKASNGADEAAFAQALKHITGHGHKGIRALNALANSEAPVISVVNENHDRLLSDFFKAETYALGAKTVGHARHVIKRLGKLDEEVGKALIEIAGDGVLALVPGDAADKRAEFLKVLHVEIQQMQSDVRAALSSC